MTSMQNDAKPHLIVGFWGVRYQVANVQRAIAFYTQTLGFNLDVQNLPAFGRVFGSRRGRRTRNGSVAALLRYPRCVESGPTIRTRRADRLSPFGPNRPKFVDSCSHSHPVAS
jgi:catechol 2,3-dioxygenase-like lactoylglutathione lyase family enzyme